MKKYPKHNNKYWCGILKKAAYALTYDEFHKHVNDILTSLPLSREFIVGSEPARWANAIFVGNRWGEINNNMVESWNSWVKEDRSLPPFAMLDSIRKKVMRMMNERREESKNMTGVLCDAPDVIVSNNYTASRSLTVERSSESVFEVQDHSKSVAVDIHRRTCSCRAWQVFRIPCVHACACIESIKQSVYVYCDPYYRVTAYRAAYMGIINPIPNVGMEAYGGEGSVYVRVPDVRSQTGRRKTQRYKSQVESGNTKCGLCGLYGHNRRTCKQVRVNAS